MRRIVIWVAGLVYFFFAAFAYAQHSDCHYANKTIAALFCFGSARLVDTTVNGKVLVTGPLIAERANMQSIEVDGTTNLSHSEVKANVVATGNINANHGSFEGDLDITSSKMKFIASSVKGSIHIRANAKNPVLELYCATHISGNVIFKGEHGTIKKSDDSIIQGKVTNATIVPTKNPVKCDQDVPTPSLVKPR